MTKLLFGVPFSDRSVRKQVKRLDAGMGELGLAVGGGGRGFGVLE